MTVMVLGNFMLLNLFLAILLKAISGEKEEDPDELPDEAEGIEQEENGEAGEGENMNYIAQL